MNADNLGLHFTAGLDNDKLRADCEESKRILHSVGNSAEKEGDRIDSSFKKIGTTVAAVFTVKALSDFTKNIIKVRSEIESLEISFETLLGNKDKAAALFGEIRQFAVQTPMMLNDLAKGAQTLLSFNVAADQVMPTLRAIGDISMGDAQKFQSLTLAFSQMSSTGKLMGQDLLQMINAGFNPLATISEQTGKSIAVLKDEMSKGQISAEMVAKAFRDATSEGGKFNGMLEKQSKGLNGMRSNLQGAVDDMMNSFGEALQEPITEALGLVTELVKNYKEVGRVIAELIAIYGAYKAAVIAVTVAQNVATQAALGYTVVQQLQYKWMLLQEAAQKLLNKTMLANPYVAAAAAIAALTIGIIRLVTRQTEAEKAQKRLNDAFKESDKQIYAETVQVDMLFGKLKAAKEGTDDYRKAKQQIITQYGDYLKGLSDEIQSLQDIEGAYKAITTAIKENARARAMEKYVQDEADVYAEKLGDIRETVREKMFEKFGSEKGSEYYWKIVPVLEGKEELTEEMQDVVEQFNESNLMFTAPGAPGYVSHFNDIRAALNQAYNAKKVFDDAMANAEARFGEVKVKENGGGGGEDETPIKSIAIQTAEAIEQVKKLEQEIADLRSGKKTKNDAGDDIKDFAEEIAAKEKALKEAQERVATLTGITDKGQTAIDAEIAQRTQKIAEMADAIIVARRQAELDIRQATIDGMEEGLDKELAQNQLNYDRLTFENEKRMAAYLENYRDMMELEWNNANPNAKKEGKSFNRASVTIEDWKAAQPELANQVDEFARIATDSWERANRVSLERMLEDVATYEQRRAKIISDYESARSQLYDKDENGNEIGLREGVSEGNLDELQRQRDMALNSLDEEFASRSQSYQSWLNQISILTVTQLRTLLEAAKKALYTLEHDPNADPVALAEARVKVLALEQTINDAELSPDIEELTKWQMYSEQLDEVGKSLTSLGDKMGGVAGEALTMLGTIMTSTSTMVKSIQQITENCLKAMEDGADKASKAIAAAQSAVAILAIIQAIYSAVCQLRDFIDNNFDTDSGFGKFASDFLHFLTDSETMLENLAWSLLGPVGTLVGMLNSTNKASDRRKHQQEIERLMNAYDELNYQVGRLGKQAENTFGETNAQIRQQQIELKKLQIDALNAAIAEEQQLKDPDEDKINGWRDQIQTLYDDIEDLETAAVDAIYGESIKTAIENFADALVDAWANGTSASEAANKYVREMIKKTALQAILDYTQASAKIDAIREKIKQYLDNDGIISESEQSEIEGMAQQLMDEVGEQFEWAQHLFEEEREGSKKGIAQASQESVDELNGRATAIQGHTYSIAENTQLLLATANAILNSVLNIEDNTASLGAKVDNINEQIRVMRNDISDITTKGIIIKR